MAAEAAAAAPPPGEETSAPKAKPGPALLVVLLNSIVLLGATGYLYYTRMVFKRPAITEKNEREKLEKTHEKKIASINPGLVNFETMTINIKTSEEPERPPKLHYVTTSFSLETREEDLVDGITPLKAHIVDKVISIVGRKSFQELTTVQGRYLLRTQLTDGINELLETFQKKNNVDWDPPLTNVYFNQFTVQ